MELRICIIMFKVYRNLLPTYVQQFFSQHEYVYATRQNYTFAQKCACIYMKSLSFSIKGVQLWNFLDSSFLSVCSSLKKNHKVNILNGHISDM